MFTSVVLPILLVIANITGAGMVVPQVLRLRRTRVSDGVSVVGVGVGIAMNLWWVAYAATQELWGLLPVAAGSGLLYFAVAVLLTQIDGTPILRPIGHGQAISAIPLVGLIVWGWAGAGLAIGLLYGAQFAPALVTAVRAVSLQGISTSMWLLALIEATIWLVYGLAEYDLALVFGGGGGAIVASFILACVAMKTPSRVGPPPVQRQLVGIPSDSVAVDR